MQLVRLAAGSSLKVRLLLQTPELIPISLSDSADGAKIHVLLSPRLHLRSDDKQTELEVQGQWQLGEAGSFSVCTFKLLKAGKFSAGEILVCVKIQRVIFIFAALSLLHTRQNFSVALPALPLESAIVCSQLGSALQPAPVDCLLTVDARQPSSRTSILSCNTTCTVGDFVHLVAVFLDEYRNVCCGAGVKVDVSGPAQSSFEVVLNPHSSSAAASSALAAVGNATSKLLIAEGHLNHVLSASFQVVRAGDFRISGLFSASPILIQAQPGPAFPSNCSLSGSGAQDVVVSASSTTVRVSIDCRDQFYNDCSCHSVQLTVTFTPKDSTLSENIKVSRDGASFQYSVSRAGTCQLVASVNAVALPPVCISVGLSSPEQALRHVAHLRQLAQSLWTQAQLAATSCELAASGENETQWQAALCSSNAAGVKACQALAVVTSSLPNASAEELVQAQQHYDDIIHRVRVSDALARRKSYKRQRLRWGDDALSQLSQHLEQRKMASADLLCRELQLLVDEFVADDSLSVQTYADGIAAAERAIRALREQDRAKEARALQQKQSLEEERLTRVAAAAEAAAKAADAAKAAAKAAAAAPPPKRTGGGFVMRFTGDAATAAAAKPKSQAQPSSEYPY